MCFDVIDLHNAGDSARNPQEDSARNPQERVALSFDEHIELWRNHIGLVPIEQMNLLLFQSVTSGV